VSYNDAETRATKDESYKEPNMPRATSDPENAKQLNRHHHLTEARAFQET